MALQRTTHRFKLVMLGDSTVGKTALITRFVQNHFTELMPATIGAHFQKQTFIMEDKIITLDVWDTAGQERFRCLVSMYYRGTNAAIVVYDIQNRNSFFAAKRWIDQLRDEAPLNIVIALVGNKTDFKDKRCVSSEEAMEYAGENGLIFMETSAKTGMNVTEIFLAVAKKLSDERKERQEVVHTMRLNEYEESDSPRHKCSCFQ